MATSGRPSATCWPRSRPRGGTPKQALRAGGRVRDAGRHPVRRGRRTPPPTPPSRGEERRPGAPALPSSAAVRQRDRQCRGGPLSPTALDRRRHRILTTAEYQEGRPVVVSQSAARPDAHSNRLPGAPTSVDCRVIDLTDVTGLDDPSSPPPGGTAGRPRSSPLIRRVPRARPARTLPGSRRSRLFGSSWHPRTDSASSWRAAASRHCRRCSCQPAIRPGEAAGSAAAAKASWREFAGKVNSARKSQQAAPACRISRAW